MPKSRGRKPKKTSPAARAPDANGVTHFYDRMGRGIARTDRNGVTTFHRFAPRRADEWQHNDLRRSTYSLQQRNDEVRRRDPEAHRAGKSAARAGAAAGVGGAPIVRRRLELIGFGWRRGSACSRKNTKQIHLRGFFSSITPHVAAAVIPPSATSSKTSSGVPIGVIERD